MPLDFGGANYETMRRLEKQLATVLNAANQRNVEAGIAAFALVRLARELVNKYPENTRHMLVEQLIVPFFRNEPVESEGGKILLM